MQRVCTIYFHQDGRLSGRVTMASSLYEAVRRAWRWFQSDAWYGPRPTSDTMFRVVLTGDSRQFWVRGSRALGPQSGAA